MTVIGHGFKFMILNWLFSFLLFQHSTLREIICLVVSSWEHAFKAFERIQCTPGNDYDCNKHNNSQCLECTQGRRRKRSRSDPWVGKISWRRKWQPTPVFLPGKSHGRRSTAGYSLWSHKESGTTKWPSMWGCACTHTHTHTHTTVKPWSSRPKVKSVQERIFEGVSFLSQVACSVILCNWSYVTK